jgi:hypothetical protein
MNPLLAPVTRALDALLAAAQPYHGLFPSLLDRQTGAMLTALPIFLTPAFLPVEVESFGETLNTAGVELPELLPQPQRRLRPLAQHRGRLQRGRNDTRPADTREDEDAVRFVLDALRQSAKPVAISVVGGAVYLIAIESGASRKGVTE